mgnify:CR=1 FL=1
MFSLSLISIWFLGDWIIFKFWYLFLSKFVLKMPSELEVHVNISPVWSLHFVGLSSEFYSTCLIIWRRYGARPDNNRVVYLYIYPGSNAKMWINLFSHPLQAAGELMEATYRAFAKLIVIGEILSQFQPFLICFSFVIRWYVWLIILWQSVI